VWGLCCVNVGDAAKNKDKDVYRHWKNIQRNEVGDSSVSTAATDTHQDRTFLI